MPPQNEKSQLKRTRGSPPADAVESKKPKINDAGLSDKTPVAHNQQLPTPGVKGDSVGDSNDVTATPPGAKTDEETPRNTDDQYSQNIALSSPPQDTQPATQFASHDIVSDEVEDEAAEGVWGYLQAWDPKYGDKPIVLKKRCACPSNDSVANAYATDKLVDTSGTPVAIREEEAYERTKIKGVAAGGYLIGRHAECDIVINDNIVSNRHCLIFAESNGNDTVAVLEDLSSNGTFVQEALVGRNRSRELEDGDEIAIYKTRFVFRYPKNRRTSAFRQQYELRGKLGKGHFAEVHLCIEKSTGKQYAVKIFSSPGIEEKAKKEGLQAEIGMLMSVSHPNVLCLKDTFNENDCVYLVLELAPEGELFNYIVAHQKLKEDETRKLFKQLFQGIKYLHERNIVHRDIKPENILLVDKDLHVKLADFGLAKIIGEESFTTTLCGTPSYVAPEILAESKNRKYTKAVDIWSLGVVLYICLCGFPPFSDELYSRDFPYTLSQQIRAGRFDYPSPYWDSIGDPALDLIDRMLVVDPEKRFTIDQCLAHPWLTQAAVNVNDSTGLVSDLAGLDVNRRAPQRQRTLLATMNDELATFRVEDTGDVVPSSQSRVTNVPREQAPSHNRGEEEFMHLGGRADQPLYGDDESATAMRDAKGKSPRK